MTPQETTFLTALAAGLLYAGLGMVQAFATGEPFDAKSFLKTVLISLVSAGAVSETQAELATAVAVQFGVVIVLDKAINALRKHWKALLPTSPPGNLGVPTPTK